MTEEQKVKLKNAISQADNYLIENSDRIKELCNEIDNILKDDLMVN